MQITHYNKIRLGKTHIAESSFLKVYKGWNVSIKISGKNEIETIQILEDTVKEIKENIDNCCSHFDDDFNCYAWWEKYQELTHITHLKDNNGDKTNTI